MDNEIVHFILCLDLIHNHGVEGMLLSTTMAGVFLMLMGFLRLGTYIKFIPYPVTVGFIAGIATILVAGQIHDFFGLTTGAMRCRPKREPT